MTLKLGNNHAITWPEKEVGEGHPLWEMGWSVEVKKFPVTFFWWTSPNIGNPTSRVISGIARA